MPVFVVNLIEAQRLWPDLQKIHFGDNLSEKIKKISEENKLFKQASKFASDGSKGFQPFCKGSQLFSQPIPQKAKAGVIPYQGESFSDQSQKEELQIQKRNLPLNRENQILSGKLVQINFRQDSFTNNKRTSNSFFRSCPKLQKIIPVTLPHSKEEYETLSQEIQSLKDKDAITEIPSTQAKFISQLLTVPECSGGKQPVINLAPLNNHIYNQPFKMEGLENLRYLLNPGDYFVKIDLSDAYLSIPVHKDSQPYLAFIFD